MNQDNFKMENINMDHRHLQNHFIDTISNRNTTVNSKLRFHVIDIHNGYLLYNPNNFDIFWITKKQAEILKVYEDLKDPRSSLPSETWAAIETFVNSIFTTYSREIPPVEESEYGAIKDLVLLVAQSCNLNCRYCYASDINKVKKLMNIDTAERALQVVLNMSNSCLSSIKFLGGEPLLNFKVVKYVVERTLELCEERNLVVPRFVIVTNGTILNHEHIKFFKKHNFYVLVSMEGMKDIHNFLRPYHSGKGSHRRTEESVQSLVASGIDVAIESVYTKAHIEAGISPLMMISYFELLGVRQFVIPPVIGEWHDLGITNHIKQVITDFREAVTYCLNSFQSDKPVLLRGVQFVLDAYMNRRRRDYICGAGRNFISVNFDGEVFPCYLLESEHTSMGNIHDNDFPNQRFHNVSRQLWNLIKDNNSTCRKCWAKEICKSCIGSSFQISNKLENPPVWFCTLQNAMIEETIKKIAEYRVNDEYWKSFICSMKKLAP